MPEIAELPQKVPLKEILPSPKYPNLRFEPAVHIGGNANYEHPLNTTPEWKNMYQKHVEGDPDAHAWQNTVKARLNETHPKIIALDGLGFNQIIQMDPPDFPMTAPPAADNVWWHLPDRPMNISDTEDKSVFVVAGDVDSIGGIFNVPLLTHPQGRDLQAIRSILNDKITADYNRTTEDIMAEASAIFGAAIIIDVALGGALGINIIRNKIKKEEKVISRRNFLKGVGVIAAATALTGAASIYKDQRINSRYQAATASTEANKERWMDIVELTEPRVIKAKQVNMRTALLALKTKDAMDELSLSSDTAGAIVMGSGHSFDARDFLESDEKAQQAVREYFDSIDPILKKALQDHPVMSYADAKSRIVDLLAQTYIMKVNEPDDSSFNTPNFAKAVEAATSVAADFKSKRIESAFT